MEIKKEISFDDLKELCWSGAIDTLKTIEENEKDEEFMNYLEGIFDNEIPTGTEVNDFLWFDSEAIFEYLGIEEE